MSLNNTFWHAHKLQYEKALKKIRNKGLIIAPDKSFKALAGAKKQVPIQQVSYQELDTSYICTVDTTCKYTMQLQKR